jgi:hypothetical protein
MEKKMKTKIMLSAVMLVMHAVCAGMDYSSNDTIAEPQLNPILYNLVNEEECVQLLDLFLNSLPEDSRSNINGQKRWQTLIHFVHYYMKCSLGELLTAKHYFDFLCQKWGNSHLSPTNEEFKINATLTVMISVVLAHKMLSDRCWGLSSICEVSNVDNKSAVECEYTALEELLGNNKLLISVERYNSAATAWININDDTVAAAK